jgi:hypothetical protein
MRAARILSTVAAVILFLLIVWSTNKGFDLADEGYYLLGYQPNQEIGATTSFYNLIVRKTFGFVELNVISVRIIDLALIVVSTLILSCSLTKWLESITGTKTSRTDRLFTLSFLFVGSLSMYDYFPHSLSYNSLTSVILATSFGLFLLVLSRRSNSGMNLRMNNILFCAIGFLLAIEFFIKASSSLVGSALFILLIVFTSNERITRHALFFLLGYLCGFIGYFVFFQQFADFHASFANGFKFLMNAEGGHDTRGQFGLMLELLRESYYLLFYSTVWVLPFLILRQISTCFFTRNPLVPSSIYCWGWVLLLSLFYAYVLYRSVLFQLLERPLNILPGASEGAKFFALPLGILLVRILFGKVFLAESIIVSSTQKNIKVAAVMSSMIVMPFVCSVGTNNPYFFNSINFLIFWFSLVISIVMFTKLSSILKSSIILSFVLIAIYSMMNGFVLHPYNQLSLLSQTETLPNIAKARGLFLDPDTKEYIEQVYEIMHSAGYRTEDPIISIYAPALVYLVGGLSPGGTMYDGSDAGPFIFGLKRSKMNITNTYFIVKDDFSESFRTELKSLGINFPEDHMLVGIIRSRRFGDTKIYMPMKRGTVP